MTGRLHHIGIMSGQKTWKLSMHILYNIIQKTYSVFDYQMAYIILRLHKATHELLQLFVLNIS